MLVADHTIESYSLSAAIIILCGKSSFRAEGVLAELKVSIR